MSPVVLVFKGNRREVTGSCHNPSGLQSRGFAGILQQDVKVYPPVWRCSGDRIVRENPSPLILSELLPRLEKCYIQANKAKKRRSYTTCRDPIESLGRSKLRLARTSFVGITLVVLGRCLMRYDERLGNIDLRRRVAWWAAYGVACFACVLIFCAALAIFAQGVEPLSL
jgi:hypothetical protein